MNAFQKAFEQLIDLEGGYVWDPNDPGGKTAWGLSERTYPKLFADGAVPTIEDAREVYFRDFWQRLGLYRFHESVATELFEVAVNAGPKMAVTLLQRALNFLGEDLTEDGILGPLTVRAVKDWELRNLRALLVAQNGEQYRYFRRVIEHWKRSGKNQPHRFAAGWLRRIGL